ncbi:unnamed protein product [Rotaria sordida]|uniref:Uncharacterized protein n=1 Tax=Rotaria sordida TaxID=392033 RepID=A0A819BIE4_9BILA|nr:unnamed protein product [Rotaria sordida]CAF1178878.1 unnamed protein product [Rotaria sordida]CAF3736799.1 unnamed protein product [Rotaria sordida]CAF3798704.1 unnamed protein product [Rotaria sordida]
MNVQTFVYNENFYKKLALTIAIIRLTPSRMTPKEYAIQIQNILRQNKINDSIQYEQILLDIRSLRKSISIIIPTKYIDLLEYYKNFLQNIFIISTEFNIEIQILIIETIDRIFQLIKENFFRIQQQQQQQNFEVLFKQLINTIVNFDIITNIQKHSIQHIRQFIDLILIYIKQSTIITNAQMLIEQIGCYQSYFLVVFERILAELLIYFDKKNSNSTYGLILINILQKLITSNDYITLKQILNNDLIRQQFHELLYTCLAFNNDNSLIIFLWNIYGRIL